MSKQTRRQFLQSGVAAGAAFSTFAIGGTKSSGAVLGANDRVRVAVAGINGRGKSHIDGFNKVQNVSVTTVIDPDSRLFAKHQGRTCVQDVREALDDKNIDVVTVATPNHWHSLMTIWACQAGKDVYVEKPLSHNVSEGRRCVEAARYYKRMVQHGTQQRSTDSRAREIDIVHSEKYGKLRVSKGYCCKPRWSIGTKPTEKPPAGLDFNVWLGPAPEQPYHGNLVHYNWHWFWDTGNGDTGNQGVHEMDVARWAIKGATLPTKVWSLGGRFGYEDQGETPNTHLSVYEYDDVLLLFETRGLVTKHKKFPFVVKNEYYTTEGMIVNGKFYPNGGGKAESITSSDATVTPGGPFGSFIQAVRSRDRADLNADVEVGHYSAALCHLGNISLRRGKQVPFDGKKNALGDNKQDVESFNTVRENLKAVGMNLNESTYQLGRTLNLDPKTETFIGDKQANRMLTREYRAPFTVPAKIG
ncbi:MAG: dehydrogenase [Planctomycetaceae bacterium]|nr:dehydrogenase [Planctomycetaceae bacterium]